MSRKQSLWRSGLILLLSAASIAAQPGTPAQVWQAVEKIPQNGPASDAWVRPKAFRAFNLNPAALRQALSRAPREATPQAAQAPAELSLPMPDGSFARYRVVESPVMAPELAAKFPEIKTYLGQGIDDPSASLRFDLTPAGFHAQILSPHGAVYIDPYWKGDPNLHACYYKRDSHRQVDDFVCLTPSGDELVAPQGAAPADLLRSGGTLRTYRLACAADGEYVQFHGGTVAQGMAAIVTAINRVTGIFETEMAIRLVLVADNDQIVYTNSNTDPYTDSSPSMLLTQNQANIDSVIGSANYDIGHVFTTGGGGIATLGCVCVNGSKARGETGLSNPIGDAFYIDFVIHEMGHQFGATHCFNSVANNCGGGNRTGSTAYEPGSGSTIMAYAGICGSDNLQLHSDPYFHSVSFDQIINFTTGGSGNSCAAQTSTGNSEPTVSAGPNFTIPRNTPFTLTATGSDPDGDALTYCWEERDLGVAQTLVDPDNGSSPLFRSFNPIASPARTFPKLSNILSNSTTLGEKLPATSRTMSFRVTARDNRAGGGGVNTDDMQVTVNASAGPFVVTFPNTSATLSGAQTIAWNVAGTAGATINAGNVNILLSTNGGLAFPIVLAASTPNDGSQTVVLPNVNTSNARIKVEAAGNIFFDISGTDFSIVPAIPAPLVIVDTAALAAENCAPANNAIDPGESVTVGFALKNVGLLNTTNLVVSLLTTNGVVSPSGSQTYGALTAGGGAVSHPFSFDASGACGGTVTATFQLQDGSANLGTLSQAFNLGSLVAATITRTNATTITIPANGNKGKASPYPSTVSVSDVTGTVSKVTVMLKGMSHTFPADVDVVLVGPDGQTVMLMSDAGGGNPVNNVTLTFDDSAAASLPNAGQITSGTYRPTDFDSVSDDFPAPAPAGPYGQTLSQLNGLDPNGSWSLFVNDDNQQDAGDIAQGWTLTITTSNSTCCSSVVSVADLAIGDSAAPALLNVGSNLTYTLTVTNFGPDTAVGVTVTDTLPAGVSFVSATPSQGTCSNNSGLVTCALGTMTNGAKTVVTIVATATASGTKTNTASVSAQTSDSNGANNTAVATVSVNAAPTISNTGDQVTDEDTPTSAIAFTIADAETPAAALTVSGTSSNLVANTNLVFGGSGGNRTVTITPLPDQFGSTTITITVSDGLASASDTFVLTVNPVNDAPMLAVIADRTIYQGGLLVFTNSATDPDLPANVLSFSLEAGGPSGASIDSATGVFNWTPGEAQVGTNLITVRVTDDGVPSLSDSKGFSVVVVSRPVIESISVSETSVTIGWTAIDGRIYRVQYKESLETGVWTDLLPDVIASGPMATKTDTVGAAQRFYRILVLP